MTCPHRWERWGDSDYDRCADCNATRARVFGQAPLRRKPSAKPPESAGGGLWDQLNPQLTLWGDNEK